MNESRVATSGLGIVGVAQLATSAACARHFPTTPFTRVVTCQRGGAHDIPARGVADKTQLEQPIVIANKPMGADRDSGGASCRSRIAA